MDISATSRHFEVVIIGAGWSGLAAAKTFLQVRPETTLLLIDGDATIGGTWSEQRLYPNLVCEAGWGLFQFSDMPMGRAGIDATGCIPGRAVYQYLHAYATQFGLHRHVLLNTVVEKVERVEGPTPWCLRVSTDTVKRTFLCDKLIVATGLTSEPSIPGVPRAGFPGPIYHSKHMGIPSTLETLSASEIENVTVLGGSKSAFEAVYSLARLGKKIQWIIRPDGGGPSLMTPLKLHGLFSAFKLNNTRFFGSLSPNVFDRSSILYRLFHGPNKLACADWVVLTFWRVTTWMISLPAQYDRSMNGKRLKPHLGFESSFWSPATLAVMTTPGLWDYVHNAESLVVHRRSVTALSERGVELDDGTCLASDAFIFATGWQAKHTIFQDKECGELGIPCPAHVAMTEHGRWQQLQSQADAEVVHSMPLLARSPPGHHANVEDDYHLYRFLVPASPKYADRSIAYIGFLRTTGLPFVLEAQALWITAYLLGHLHVPAQAARERECARTNSWIRRRYVCGRKVPFALVDWFPYIDLLYEDLGVSSRRRSSWLMEYFAVRRPEEYRGVVNEWMAGKGTSGATEAQSTFWRYVLMLDGSVSLVSLLCVFSLALGCWGAMK